MAGPAQQWGRELEKRRPLPEVPATGLAVDVLQELRVGVGEDGMHRRERLRELVALEGFEVHAHLHSAPELRVALERALSVRPSDKQHRELSVRVVVEGPQLLVPQVGEVLALVDHDDATALAEHLGAKPTQVSHGTRSQLPEGLSEQLFVDLLQLR